MTSFKLSALAACLLSSASCAASTTAPGNPPQASDPAAAVPAPAYVSTLDAYRPLAKDRETADRRWLLANREVAGGGMQMAPADPHAGHKMSADDPHAGHKMPIDKPAAEESKADPHPGHNMKHEGP